MTTTTTIPVRHVWSWHAPVSALILWIALWVNLDTGFWNIKSPNNGSEWQLLIRAVLPFGVLPVAVLILFHRRRLKLQWSKPSSLLMIYGVLATLASVFSPDPFASLYWSATFLATILAAWTFLDPRDPVRSTRQMLQITWVATFIVAAIISRQASNAIFGHASSGYYTVKDELEGLTRASGVARWAAVPGLVCLVRAYHSRRPIISVAYMSFAAVAFFIVYRMQSRGAIFGSVAALLFALLVSSRMRRYALPFALGALVLISLLETPVVLANQIATYIERGQTKEEFLSMTGRTRAYQNGLISFEDAPIFGRGQWSDRMLIHEHVHNSYLQALMNAGVVGGIPYFASWIAGWMLFFSLQKRRAWLNPKDRLCVLESGTVMMFFMVRSIPETTTASFAVDLLVVIAIYVYLETLADHLRAMQRRQTVLFFNAASFWSREARQLAHMNMQHEI
jgi:O-antigen ligase